MRTKRAYTVYFAALILVVCLPGSCHFPPCWLQHSDVCFRGRETNFDMKPNYIHMFQSTIYSPSLSSANYSVISKY
jgi:hypothetical protein